MSGSTSTPGVVAFDYAGWTTRYPEFSCVSPTLAAAYFAEAGLYCSNQPNSKIRDLTTRGLILWMVAAHIAALAGQATQAASEGSIAPVGRMASVGEGSDSVSFDLQVPGTIGWWSSTNYGLNAWQAMSPYRFATYIPSYRRRY
jgi:hypothetical protein